MTAVRLRRPPGWSIDLAAGWFIAGFVPVQRVASIHQGYGWRTGAVTGIVLLGCIALVTTRRLASDMRVTLATTAAVAALGGIAGGRLVGMWLVPAFVLGAWVAMRRDLPLLGVCPRSAVLPVAGLVLLSGRVARDHQRWLLALGLFVLAAAVALLVKRDPDLPRRAGRSTASVVRVVVGIAVLAPLWLFTALLPWVFQRLVRFDPVAARSPAGGGWIPLGAPALRSDRLWTEGVDRDRPPLGRRVHARLPGLLAIGTVVTVIAGVVYVREVEPLLHPEPANQAEAALLAGPDAAAIRQSTEDAIADIWFSQWVGNEWSDHRSEHVNITNGRRATWSPTNCPDRAIRVWFFGGSAAFGVMQADDDTIPSELAKAAERAGYELQIENWGMPGDVAWQEVRRLERALIGEPPPDVVVLYDGWNDLRAVQDLDLSGREGMTTDIVGPLDRVQERALQDLAGAQPGDRRIVQVPEATNTPDTATAHRIATTSYRNAHDAAASMTADRGIALLHAYQPSLLTRSRAVPGEPDPDPGAVDAVAAFRADLPPGVVDLGSALDHVERPVFYDEVHTLPDGSERIAATLLDSVRPSLDTVVVSTGRGRCR